MKLQILQQLLRQSLQRVPQEREARMRWQNRQLEQHVRKIAKKSPFYAQYLHQHGHWSKFPLINKSIFMENFDQINTQGIKKEEAMHIALQAEQSRDFSPMIGKITVGLSSGTSGNRGIFLVSPRERAQWVAYVLRKLIGLQFKKRKIAFFLRANSNLYNSVQSSLLEFRFFDLLAPLAQNLAQLKDYQPNILVAQPSMLLMIAQAQQDLQLKPQKIISVAEVLEPTDRAYMENVFQQTIHQAYQCTEGFLAHSCSEGRLHYHEDLIKIEKKYIDKEQRRYHPIISDFTRSTQPLIRYELNDLVVDYEGTCACGSNYQAIDHIEGRSDDLFYFYNNHHELTPVFPDFIRRSVISSDDRILEYVVEQLDYDRILVYLRSPHFDQIHPKVRQTLEHTLQKQQIENVDILFKEELPKLGDQKLRRVRRRFFMNPDT